MSSRIYRVDAVFGPNQKTKPFLVWGVSPARAQAHVAKKYINAKVATPSDVAELMANGVIPEQSDAVDPAAPPPTQASVEPPPVAANGAAQ